MKRRIADEHHALHLSRLGNTPSHGDLDPIECKVQILCIIDQLTFYDIQHIQFRVSSKICSAVS